MTSRQAGLSLPELLVATALFSVAALAAARLYATTHSGATLAAHRGDLHERVAYAIGSLTADLQMAGYRAAAGPRMPDVIAPPVGPSACGLSGTLVIVPPVEITDGRYAHDCPPSAGGSLAGSDVLTLRRLSAQPAAPAAGRLQVEIAPGGAARVDWDGRVASALPGNERHDVLVHSYYVARRADGTAAADAVPALRRKTLTAIAGRPAFIDTEVLPGIEDLQAEVGWRDATGTLRFAAVAPAGAALAAVRVWLLVRGERIDPALPPPAPLVYAGQERRPVGAFHRVLVTRQFALRNADAP